MAEFDFSDPRPIHEQLAEQLRQRIRNGDLKPGERLPPARKLAEHYGVSPMTVNQAVRILREEGLTVSRHGVGVFVRDPSKPSPMPATAESIAALHDEVRALTARIEDLAQQLRKVLDVEP